MAQVDFLRALLAGGKGHLQGKEFARQLQAQYQQQEYDNQLKAQDMQRLQQLAASHVGLQGAQTEGMLSATGRAETQFGIEQPVMEAQAGFDINKIDMEDRLLGPTETARRTGLEAAVPQAQLQGAVAQTGLELQPKVEEAAGLTLEQRVGLLTKLKALGYTDQQAAAMVQDEVTREQVGKTAEAQAVADESIIPQRLATEREQLASQSKAFVRVGEQLDFELSPGDRWAAEQAILHGTPHAEIVEKYGVKVADTVAGVNAVMRKSEDGLPMSMTMGTPIGQQVVPSSRDIEEWELQQDATRAGITAQEAGTRLGFDSLGLQGELGRGNLQLQWAVQKLNNKKFSSGEKWRELDAELKLLESLSNFEILNNPYKVWGAAKLLLKDGVINRAHYDDIMTMGPQRALERLRVYATATNPASYPSPTTGTTGGGVDFLPAP